MNNKSLSQSLHGIATLILIITAIVLLASEHLDHLLQYLPLLIILLCPLMHFFMHRHGGHHHSEGTNRQTGDDQQSGK